MISCQLRAQPNATSCVRLCQVEMLDVLPANVLTIFLQLKEHTLNTRYECTHE